MLHAWMPSTETVVIAFFVFAGLGWLVHAVRRRIPACIEQDAFDGWVREYQARGLSHSEAFDELMQMRVPLARVRERASDATLKEPGRALEFVGKFIREEEQRIASFDMKRARAFANWCRTLGTSDILYPDAMQALQRHVAEQSSRSTPRTQSLEERRTVLAAMRVLR
jgi:hypothetical protein